MFTTVSEWGVSLVTPWSKVNLIGESDKAAVFVRDVQDVTEHSGQDLALELQVLLPLPEAERRKARPDPPRTWPP